MEMKKRNKLSKEQFMELNEKRIGQKLKLVEKFPNAWVYEFSNPLIRTNLRTPFRIVELANNAFREYWGFETTTEDIEKIDNIFSEIEKKAKDVIELGYEYGSNLTDFNISKLENMKKYEKEKAVRENRNLIEVIIPSNDKSKTIYEAIILIDVLDLPIKQSKTTQEIEKWINAVKDFIDTIKKSESESIKLTAEKLKPELLSRYKSLRNNVIRYLKATNSNNATEEKE